ncbi:hypothetical protein VDG1235_2305 [Verrucomicrobiia bacterium DG1235]|nr:hypothetical protein VDG1235_2305 [Verrucomicrobiae bacterium DG1235]
MNLFSSGKRTAYAVACLLVCKLAALAHSQPVEQATVEAAMTLQLLSFTEWPETENADPAEPRRIGVFNSAESLEAFQNLLADPRFQGRYIVKHAHSEMTAEELASFHAIFFNKPEPAEIPRLIRKLENKPVVLIGTFEGFLEQGGLVNLVKRQRRLGFEIQLDNSERRGIDYRAKLLRLAARLVKE